MTPNNRHEAYLAAIAGDPVQYPEKPLTREEAYLDRIAKNSGGGGGGGSIHVEKGNVGSTTDVGALPSWSISQGVATFNPGVLPTVGAATVVTDVTSGG